MEGEPKVNKEVPVQRAVGRAAVGARSVQAQIREGKGDDGSFHPSWLVSDRSIRIAMFVVAFFGICIIVWMWLIASNAATEVQANLHIEALRYGLGIFAAAGAVAALLLGMRRQQLSESTHALELIKHKKTKNDAEDLREREIDKQKHTEADAAERRVTDLYTKAVEQLGHAAAAVRLGGLYALDRLAESVPQQRPTIVYVLCAYLRMQYTPLGEPEEDEVIRGLAKLTALSPKVSPGAHDPQQELQVRLTAQEILIKHLWCPDAANPPGTFWPDVDLNLSGAWLIDWQFDHCRVHAARFDQATFSGDAGFGDATFSEETRFDKATFSATTRFVGATFSKAVSFEGANFSGVAWFEKVRFFGDAHFKEAKFSGDVWFDKAELSGKAKFDKVTFSGDAQFDQAKFSGDARFDQAIFFGDAWFGESAFSREAQFGGATFVGHALFRGTESTNNSCNPDLSNCKVRRGNGRKDVWPPGWVVVPTPDPAYDMLVYDTSLPGSEAEYSL